MLSRRYILAGATALVLAACAYDKPGKAQSMQPTRANVAVSIMPDGEGGYKFRYQGEYSDEEGNLNFSQGRISEGPVIIVFSIAEAPEGMKFRSPGADAIWIADKELVGDEGSPEGPYVGKEFSKFETGGDGKTLMLLNENNDRKIYRYGLRFDFKGDVVMHDPDLENGGHG